VSLLEMSDVHAGYGGAMILQRASASTSRRARSASSSVPTGRASRPRSRRCSGCSTSLKGRQLRRRRHHQHAPEKLVRLGLSFVPQEFNVFPTLTVEENLEMGAYIRRDSWRHLIEETFELFPPLKDKRRQPAGELSGGQRQMVAIGRALMTEPRLLLLDEPTAGLSPRFMSEIFERIIAINQRGVGILMVEQNAKQALAIAHRGFVLANGQNLFTDTGAALLGNPEVARAFLGG
jgi:branched-chain amino acid transport system ATP-binding protein